MLTSDDNFKIHPFLIWCVHMDSHHEDDDDDGVYPK